MSFNGLIAHFFFITEKNSIIWINKGLFIHLMKDSLVQVLAIMKKAAIIYVQVSV